MAKEIKIDKLYQGFEKVDTIEIKINSSNVFGKDLYKILWVQCDASRREILNSYQKLSPKWHPDRFGQPGHLAKTKKQAEEKFEEIKSAADILTNSDYRKEYDNKLKNGDLNLDKINDHKYRNLLIQTTNNKPFVKNDFLLLPKNLHDWRNKIEHQGNSATFDQINSYVSRLWAIAGNLVFIDYEIKKFGFYEMKISSFAERFSDPESKDQVEKVFQEITQEINQKADKIGKSDPQDSLKRKKIKEMKEIFNFSLLIENGESDQYEQAILNAFAEKDSRGYITKSLEEVINDILKSAERKIKNLLDKRKNENILKPKKKEYLEKLHKIEGWKTLLEPWEQDHLEEKINVISKNEDSLFNKCIEYANYFILGGNLRKYRANFWNKLEKLTDLKKEAIRQDDGYTNNKIGERYESISTRYKGIEPWPINRLDSENLLKMKLFLCYYKKEAKLNYQELIEKIASYGGNIDSGWTPSKRGVDLLKYEQAEAIENLEKQLISYGKFGSENEILGVNWRRRFDIEGTSSNKIKKILLDFEERLYSYRNEKIPCPWKGGKGLSQQLDPLKEEKKEAIAEILKEIFGKEPVISEEKLKKDNQNWKNDINNASQEEEINFIKLKVIKDINNKRNKEKQKNSLDDLISKAKKDENWNNYQNLKNLLWKIKELQFSDLYKENKLEIHAIEKRLKELNPADYKNSTKNDLDKKLENNGLSWEETSKDTQKLINEAIESNDLEKREKAEEAIIQEGVDKKLDSIITIIKKSIKKGDLTNDQKKEYITKILECISENEYQKKAYQKKKDKVNQLLSNLRGKDEHQVPEEGSPFSKIIIVTLVTSIIITILVAAAMKISAYRKRRNIQ